MFQPKCKLDNLIEDGESRETDSLLSAQNDHKPFYGSGTRHKFADFVSESAEDSDSEGEVQLVPYAPDGDYGWVIVLIAFLSNLVLDGVSLCPGVLQNVIQEAGGKILRNSTKTELKFEFHNGESENDVHEDYEYVISVAMYSLIGSILLSMQFLVGPLISLITHQIGYRAVGIAGPIVASLGIFLSWAICPVVPNIWVLLVFYGLMTGIGFGMMYQTSIVMVGIYFDKKRSLATGIAICGTGVGSVVFPIAVNFFVDCGYGWQGAFLLQAGIVLCSTSLAFFYRPLPMKFMKIENQPRTARCGSLSIEIEPGCFSMIKAMGSLCKSPTFIIVAVSSAITTLGFFGPYAFVPGMAVTGLHMSMKSSVFAVTCIGIANTIGRLLFGYIADQHWVNLLYLNNGSLTIGGIATILVPFMTEEYQMFIFVIIFGFTIGIFAVLRSVLVIKFMGLEKIDNSFGLVLMCMGVTTLIGNPIGGWLKDQTGNYDCSFYAAGGYFVISAVMSYPLQYISEWENKNKSHNIRRNQNLAAKPLPYICGSDSLSAA